MLILKRSEVEELLDVDRLIDGLAAAFIELSAGRASVPPRVAAFAPDDAGFLGAMPGFVDGILETKLVSVFHGNHERGLPSHQALICLFDPEAGTPVAVMDGAHITAMRTAAASALATRTVARDDVKVLSVIGAGVQGASHLELVPRVRAFEEIRIASKNRSHAESLAASTNAIAVDTFEDAVRGADVVCLCTDSTAPVIKASWLSPGAHVTSVGANPRGGELDRATVRSDLVVVESRAALRPPPAGAFELQGMDDEDVVELGEILGNDHPGRTKDEQITVYKSMGHAVEDAVAARLVHEAALVAGVGTTVDI